MATTPTSATTLTTTKTTILPIDQSFLELSPATHAKIHELPRASEVILHARQKLVADLDDYCQRQPELFQRVIDTLEGVV